MTDDRRSKLIAVTIPAVLLMLLFIDVIAGIGVFYSRDVSEYHFPGKKVLSEIVRGGELPLWNPFFSAGQPLAANPANEVFYPLTWLILLPSFVYGFQLLALIHVYLATFATFALLRSLGASRVAAVTGALSFGLGGFVLSALSLFPFLFSAAWMPVTCLFARRFLRERQRRDFVFAAIALAMQLLIGEPIMVVQTGIVLGIYALLRRDSSPLRDVALVGAISLAALLVSAVQTLPAFDHFSDSVRAKGFDFRFVSAWSTPPIRLAETIYPDLLGSPRIDSNAPYWGERIYGEKPEGFLLSIYPGLLILAAAVAGVAARSRGWRIYLAIVATSVLLALGDHTPLLRLLYDAGLRSLRYPEKFLIMGLFATSIFGALSFDEVLRGDARVRRFAIVFACATAVIALCITPISAATFRDFWRLGANVDVAPLLSAARRGWVAAAIRGALVALVFLSARGPRIRTAALALILLTIDLGSRSFDLAPRTSPAFYTDPPPVVAQLAPDRDNYRIFNVHEWLPNARNRAPYLIRRPQFFLVQRNALTGLTPAAYGLRGVMDNDFDLTSLAVTDDFASAAWELSGRSKDWLNYVAAMSNIRYVGLYRPFAQEVAAAGNDARKLRPVRFIEGRDNPRYYFATQLVTSRGRREFVENIASGHYPHEAAFIPANAFTPAPGRVLRATESANAATIDVETSGTAFLVMSVTSHKYWTITIDGVETPPILTNLTYQGVVVPRGRHRIAMRYRNPLIAAGASISIVAIIALLAFARPARRR